MRESNLTPCETPRRFDHISLRGGLLLNGSGYEESKKRELQLSDQELYGHHNDTTEQEPIDKEQVRVWRSLYSYEPV